MTVVNKIKIAVIILLFYMIIPKDVPDGIKQLVSH